VESFKNHGGPPSRIRRDARALLNKAVSYVNSFPCQSVPSTAHNLAPSYSPYHERFRHQLHDGPVILPHGKKVTKQKPFDPSSVGGFVLKPWQWKCSLCTTTKLHRPVYNCVVCLQNPSCLCQGQSASLLYPPDVLLDMLYDQSVTADITLHSRKSQLDPS
jgi:hypothetical protein